MTALQVGAALSQADDTQEAARSATRTALHRAGLASARWAFCFFTASHLSHADVLRRTVVQEARCDALCGCSAIGVIGDGEEVERAPAVAVLLGDGGSLETHSEILELTGGGLTGYEALATWQRGSPALFALPDTFRVDHSILRQQLEDALRQVPVYGAGSTDDGTLGISLQIGMEGVRSNAMATLGFFGDIELAVGITQSCTPVGEPRFITRASEYVLMELDGQPAFNAFVEQGQALGLETMQQAAQELLFGFPLDPEAPSFTGENCLVRHLAGFDQESHGLVIPHPLHEQQPLGFMHRSAGSAEQDVVRMATELRERLGGEPAFGLYFDCAARGRGLYGRGGVDPDRIHEVLGDFPLVGMLGGFEIGTSHGSPHVYTYTGVLVLVRERG